MANNSQILPQVRNSKVPSISTMKRTNKKSFIHLNSKEILVQAATTASSPNICTNDCDKPQVGCFFFCFWLLILVWGPSIPLSKRSCISALHRFHHNSFSSCRCGERKVVRTRIVGGQNAQKNEYPWQVYNIKKSNLIIKN